MGGATGALSERPRRKLIVVGAGVSGCTCAALLAEAGAEITVLSPALDHLCEPSFGPEVRDAGPGGERLARALSSLPKPMQEAWGVAMLRSSDGGVSLVDRRLLSIGMKQALESIECLSMRQGLVVGLKVRPDRGEPGLGEGATGSRRRTDSRGPSCESRRDVVEVETAFGEVLEGDAVVVAVGLGLTDPRARESAGPGADECGSSPAGGLECCLREMGAELVSISAEVWPTYSVVEVGAGGGAGLGDAVQRDGHRLASGWTLRKVALDRVRTAPSGAGWEGPPSPYDEHELWTRHAWSADLEDGSRVGVALPDGIVTGEVAVVPDCARGLSSGVDGDGWATPVLGVMTRPGLVVSGLTAANLDRAGRVQGANGPAPVWITGRTAGATGYLDSIEAGMATGKAIAGAFLFGEADG